MICKYCGRPLSGGFCTSCRKTASLSYTSHELSDMLGLDKTPPPLSPQPPINQEQLRAAYEEGFSSGNKHGYSIGWDAAQKDAIEKNKHKQHLLMIVAASAMVLLAVICSFAFNSIGFSRGYQQGNVEGKQEQKTEDEATISEKLISEHQNGYDEGHRVGYEEGKTTGYEIGFNEGILATPSPSPTPSSTPSPTPAPIVLKMKDKGLKVRQLQQRLIMLGFLEQGEDDGDFGPKTKKAIEKFQNKNGITPVDGAIVRRDLWDLIMSENAIPMIPTPTPTSESYSQDPNPTPTPLELDITTSAPGNSSSPKPDDTIPPKTTDTFDDDDDNGNPEVPEMDEEQQENTDEENNTMAPDESLPTSV